MSRGAWPKRSDPPFSAGFRWSVWIVAIGGLFAIGYQLWNGELCTMRKDVFVCTSGTRAYLFAAALAFACLGIGAIALPSQWSRTIQRACWILAGLSGLISLTM